MFFCPVRQPRPTSVFQPLPPPSHTKAFATVCIQPSGVPSSVQPRARARTIAVARRLPCVSVPVQVEGLLSGPMQLRGMQRGTGWHLDLLAPPQDLLHLFGGQLPV